MRPPSRALAARRRAGRRGAVPGRQRRSRRCRPSARAGTSSRTRSRSSRSSSTVRSIISSTFVRRGLRRAASVRCRRRRRSPRGCRTRSRSWRPSTTSAFFSERRHTRRQLHQRAVLRRLRAVRSGAEDHDALAAGAGGRPARVHAARQRREPDRLHVRRRCGRRLAARWCRRAAPAATVDFASGAPVSVNAVVADDGARARRRRHACATKGTPRNTSSFIPSTARCAIGSASRRRSRSTTGLRRLVEFLEQEAHAARRQHRVLASASSTNTSPRSKATTRRSPASSATSTAMYRAEVLARVAADCAAATSSRSAAARA